MQKKGVLYFLFFCITILQGNGQENKLFQNNSIKYKVLYISPQIPNDKEVVPSKYIIKVQLRNSERKFIKSLKNEEWLKLLLDNKTNWVANLLLYDIYQKDALLYNTIIISKHDWVAVNKQKDISYWRKFLKLN